MKTDVQNAIETQLFDLIEDARSMNKIEFTHRAQTLVDMYMETIVALVEGDNYPEHGGFFSGKELN